ncbi:hypothetical protein C8R43DRAFT_1118182 [Mycena crocata]|nr:hypothetical protein C8R43DRAFT_1118182 [Mycena crocata]
MTGGSRLSNYDSYFLRPAAIGNNASEYPQIRRRRDRITEQFAFVFLETQLAPNTLWIQTPIEIWLTFFVFKTALFSPGSHPILNSVQCRPVVMLFPGAGVRWGYLYGHTRNYTESIIPAPYLPAEPRFWLQPPQLPVPHDSHGGESFKLLITVEIGGMIERRL